MQVALGNADSGTAHSLAPAVHAICCYVCLRGPKDPLSQDMGPFLGISFRLTDNLDRECGGVKNKAVGDTHPPHPEDEGRKRYSTHRKS